MKIMVMASGWWKRGNMYVEEYKAHVLMILSALSSALLLLLLQFTFSAESGSSTSTATAPPVVIVFYQHLFSTFLLFSFAFLYERNTNRCFSFHLFCWAFLLGFLQITLSETVIVSSLPLGPGKLRSTVMNTSPVIIFVLAVIFRRESFEFFSFKGQAKLWGVALSFLGATVIAPWPGPELHEPTRLGASFGAFTPSNSSFGIALVVLAVLAVASAALILEYVAINYDSDMCLAAMISLSGAIQTAAVAALKERSRSVWLAVFHGGLETSTVIFGGLVVSGVMYYSQTWCIHKRGPVFASAFSPLLMVFYFLLETIIFNKHAHVVSILGSLTVVIGLYLLLWGKATSIEEESIWEDSESGIIPDYEPLGLTSPLVRYISGFPFVIT